MSSSHRKRPKMARLSWLLVATIPLVAEALGVSLVASNAALRVVQNMASYVAAPPRRNGKRVPKTLADNLEYEMDVEGIGGPVMANGKMEVVKRRSLREALLSRPKDSPKEKPKEQVWTALSRLEANSKKIVP